MSKPLTVSLIIPVYNEQDYLYRCLESVAAQTVAPMEVIVIDNNSTDNTLQCLKKFPFVTLLHEPKQGALYARNRGFNASKGDIIGRIDADTRLEPNWIAKLIEDFEDADLAAVTGSSHWYDMPFSPFNHWVEDFFKNMLFKHERNFPFLFGTNMAIRKTAWKAVRSELCDQKYIFEDADLAIHLFQNKQTLLYDINLRAGMSARRGTDTFKGFLRYIKLQKITYGQHGINTIGSSISIMAYVVGFIVLRPLYFCYDPKTQKFSLRKLFFDRNKPRPHPFD